MKKHTESPAAIPSKWHWRDMLSLNQKGGIYLGLFSLIMAAGCIDVLFIHRGLDLPIGVRWTYATVLGAFTGTKIAAKFIDKRNTDGE